VSNKPEDSEMTDQSKGLEDSLALAKALEEQEAKDQQTELE
jgi:hypothetical protein